MGGLFIFLGFIGLLVAGCYRLIKRASNAISQIDQTIPIPEPWDGPVPVKPTREEIERLAFKDLDGQMAVWSKKLDRGEISDSKYEEEINILLDAKELIRQRKV